MNACHCDACKKMSGGTNLLIITAPRAAFEHLSGEVHRFRRTAESGRQSDVVRCATCGTRLWHEPQTVSHLIVIAAGTLDDPSWVVPASIAGLRRLRRPPSCRKMRSSSKASSPRDLQIAAFQKLYGDGA